jgi:hypothetical protein
VKPTGVLVLVLCSVAGAQTNFTFGPGTSSSGNVPPPYIATGTWTSGSTPPVPYTPITTDGWGNLSSVGALMSYGGIGGQGLTISQGTQAVVVLAIPNNGSTGTVTNQYEPSRRIGHTAAPIKRSECNWAA